MKIRYAKTLENGGSLPEVVASITIIAILAGGIITSFNYGFFAMGMARENQRATQVMQEVTETIRLYNWEQVNSNGFILSSYTNVYDPQALPGQQGTTYYVSLQVVNPALSGNPSYATNMRQLDILVTWTNSLSTLVRTRSISTLIARDGIQNYVY